MFGVKPPLGGGGAINLRQGRPRFDFPAAPGLWVTVYFTLPLTLILKWETHLLKTRESKRGGGEAGRGGRGAAASMNEPARAAGAANARRLHSNRLTNFTSKLHVHVITRRRDPRSKLV